MRRYLTFSRFVPAVVATLAIGLGACSNPAGPDVFVEPIQIAILYGEDIPLSGQYPPGTYVLRVNGVERTFTTR